MKKLLLALALALAAALASQADAQQGRYYMTMDGRIIWLEPLGPPVYRDPSRNISAPTNPLDPYGQRQYVPEPGTYNPVWNN